MIKLTDFNKPYYKMKEVASLLGVTSKTIQNYVNSGKLTAIRSDGGHRLIEKQSLINYLDSRGMLLNDLGSVKKNVIYARVSSYEQKENGDLDRQVMRVIDFVGELTNIVVLKEVGSGLNDKRRQLLKLISMVLNDEVSKIYVTYKDRLTRFGFNYLELVFKSKGVDIIVLDSFENEKNIENELADDILSLITGYSEKLHEMSSGRKKKLISEIESL